MPEKTGKDQSMFPVRYFDQVSDGSLPRSAIHVWQVDLANQTLENHFCVLSAAERERAVRYRLAEDRLRFAITRSALRRVIEHYLKVPAPEIVFAYGSCGRPELPADHNLTELHFSVSHAGSYALLAFARGDAIGVDIEDLRTKRNFPMLAHNLFDAREYERWCQLPVTEGQRFLLQSWARREALAKALGLGLRMTTAQCVAALEGPDRLFVHDIHIDAQSIAALASSVAEPEIIIYPYHV
jgi:4'-phosphopantetheinyl transferase